MENAIEELQRKQHELQTSLAALSIEIENLKEQPKEKTYTWEECFIGKGFWCDVSEILESTFEGLAAVHSNISVATTEKVIKSHLAACKLSHIIEAINKDFEDKGVPKSICYNLKNGFCMSFDKWALPSLNSDEAGEKLIETNEYILLQYFGVE